MPIMSLLGGNASVALLSLILEQINGFSSEAHVQKRLGFFFYFFLSRN
jgi:hypothetical protein